jgi:hypothetical protein
VTTKAQRRAEFGRSITRRRDTRAGSGSESPSSAAKVGRLLCLWAPPFGFTVRNPKWERQSSPRSRCGCAISRSRSIMARKAGDADGQISIRGGPLTDRIRSCWRVFYRGCARPSRGFRRWQGIGRRGHDRSGGSSTGRSPGCVSGSLAGRGRCPCCCGMRHCLSVMTIKSRGLTSCFLRERQRPISMPVPPFVQNASSLDLCEERGAQVGLDAQK